MGIIGFDRKRLEPRELPWQWHHTCRCHISGAKFEDYCSNTSRDILDSDFTILVAHSFLICIIQRS